MGIIKKIMHIIILALAVLIGSYMFIAFSYVTFRLSPIMGIGFVSCVIIATYRGILNLRTMVAIFIGTMVSYAAITMIPQFFDNIFAGDFIAGLIYLFLIIYLWLESQRLRGLRRKIVHLGDL